MKATRNKSATPLSLSLRAVLYPENGLWFAHCLELDIVAEGRTPKQAIKSLDELCELQVRVALDEGDLESIFRPAPAEIWKLFFMAKKTPAPLRKPTSPVKHFEARKLVVA